jgi:hypothetical protein
LNAEGIGVSPVITRAFNFRQFLVELCECFDAYPTYDSQGRLGLALVRESAATPVTVEPADLVDAPTLNPQGWPDTFNETFVRFTNRDKRFQEDSVAYRDRGNFQITQAVLSQTLEPVVDHPPGRRPEDRQRCGEGDCAAAPCRHAAAP